MMLHLKSVLTDDEVAAVRNILAAAEWVDGRLTSGTQSADLKRNRQLPEQGAACQQAQQIVLSALRRNQLFFSAALPGKISPPLFSWYEAGDYLDDHVDVALRYSGGERVRGDLSCTLFLSEPDSYSGGELVIADAWRDEVVKLAAGDMVLYPANRVHRVKPIEAGARQACFFWIESMVRSAEQRDLLFEMDRNLMQLRAEPAATAEARAALLGLTGVYHNLLRQWADS
ncbi:Fe2+-dependent dioxygenase [Duganella sp. FT80W]|uniref:Fe2+-dependent dioxygenase n=1 Tax=Duganella guangzhouensis TaxID=2666084 RepID=A0A6I2KVF3_9BURK|nr:Fe2+-dependent dioxygenase [Duganella guangzhouensis]MRW89918.1 Fe2+-dependent dioxygenase [Duganella guangzhouensis]